MRTTISVRLLLALLLVGAFELSAAHECGECVDVLPKLTDDTKTPEYLQKEADRRAMEARMREHYKAEELRRAEWEKEHDAEVLRDRTIFYSALALIVLIFHFQSRRRE